MMKKLISLLLVAVILTACGAGGHSVKTGTSIDYISAVEQRVNGAYYIFNRYDQSNVYCTFDDKLAKSATDLLNRQVMTVITYSGINAGDKDSQGLYGLSGTGCQNLDKLQVLRLDSVAQFSAGESNQP